MRFRRTPDALSRQPFRWGVIRSLSVRVLAGAGLSVQTSVQPKRPLSGRDHREAELTRVAGLGKVYPEAPPGALRSLQSRVSADPHVARRVKKLHRPYHSHFTVMITHDTQGSLSLSSWTGSFEVFLLLRSETSELWERWRDKRFTSCSRCVS